MKKNKLLYGIFTIVVLAVAGIGLLIYQKSVIPRRINNFNDCAKAGYPITLTYPRQCRTSGGKTFVETLTIEQAKELLAQRLLNQNGVVDVRIDECAGEPCIKVTLEKGLENLPNLEDKIPSQSHGFIVVTEITGPICTLETKVCPGGSAVGRNPAFNCEFDPCP